MIKLFAYSARELVNYVAGPTRARAGECNSSLVYFSLNGTVDFSTHCSTSNNTWQQRVLLEDIKSIPEDELENVHGFEDLSKYPDVLNGNIRVGCNCPSFVFWGNAYEVDSVDSGEGSLGRYQDAGYPEGRPPTRNIHLPGYLCKHLISVISTFFV